MQTFINQHQLNQIIDLVKQEYETFASQEIEGEWVFGKLYKTHLKFPAKKVSIPFKNILWPNGHNGTPKYGKVAFLGLTNCDAIALERFLEEFAHTDLLPKRENIFVLSSECISDEYCFCTALGLEKMQYFDLHIQKEKDKFAVFSGTKAGDHILDEAGIKSTLRKPKIRDIKLLERETLNKNAITEAIIDLENHQEFWQKIANNCFGCGSCTAVCPLCFCVHKSEKNEPDGTSARCLSWDSCFAKSFSEIQNHQDMRPERINRLYNWYHHKFVRSLKDKRDFLCTGCGRCIENCPAHLNQYKIVESLVKQEEKAENA